MCERSISFFFIISIYFFSLTGGHHFHFPNLELSHMPKILQIISHSNKSVIYFPPVAVLLSIFFLFLIPKKKIIFLWHYSFITWMVAIILPWIWNAVGFLRLYCIVLMTLTNYERTKYPDGQEQQHNKINKNCLLYIFILQNRSPV